MSAADAMIGIRYIGSKPTKVDNINHTRTVWNGKGDVKPYPASLAAKLLYMHEDIWEIADQGKAIRTPAPPAATANVATDKRQNAETAVRNKERQIIRETNIRQAPTHAGSSVPGVLSLPDDWELLERLSNEQLGAYLRLTKLAAGEPVEDDDEALATAVGVEVSAFNEIRPAVAKFFQIIGGRWRHRAIETAIAAAAEERQARVDRGRNAARTRWGGKPSTSER